jgi:hypothetical protein
MEEKMEIIRRSRRKKRAEKGQKKPVIAPKICEVHLLNFLNNRIEKIRVQGGDRPQGTLGMDSK